MRLLKEHLTPSKYQKWLGELRRNMANYIPFLFVFAPRVVGGKRWNTSLEIWEKVGKGSSQESSTDVRHSCNFDQLFSVSDEAFLLLVIDNYIGPWYSEIMANTTEMRSMGMVVSVYFGFDVLGCEEWSMLY